VSGLTAGGELASAQPGFQLQVLLSSLGYPWRFATLLRWRDQEALNAFFRTEEWREFAQTNPNPIEDLATRVRPTEAYEVVLDVVSQGREAKYVELWDWTLKLNRRGMAACEQHWKQLFDMRRTTCRVLSRAGSGGSWVTPLGVW
jgi:heme-degrading monooxygenase HmoA